MQTSSTQVLVVHRDPELARRLRDQSGTFANVDLSFTDGTNAPAFTLPETVPDIIVLDLTVPVPPGFDVYRVIHPRSAGAPPVLILRARGKRLTSRGHRERWHVDQGIEAIETSLHMALGRRPHRLGGLLVRFRGTHLLADLPNSHVFVDGRMVWLSARESELLALLVAHVNRLVRREVIISEIWGFETRSLDVHVRRLRRKLGPAGEQIETVVAFGYRFAEPAVSPTVGS
jgi:two-component system phosphate regulon response regulator PhoB